MGKMKKIVLCVLFVELFLFSVCQAKNVTADNAAIVAEKFLASKGLFQKKLVLRNNIRQGAARIQSQSAAAPAYHIFTMADGAGLVIVSGDDIAKPILGYSHKGTIEDDGSLPPNMQAWLDDIESQILQARESGVQQSEETAKQWDSPTVGAATLQLKTAQWHQRSPFNQQCPFDNDKRSVSGCVPTAHAILMKYYGYPSKGRGTTKGYMVESNGIAVAGRNLEHSYNWDLMPMEYNDGQYTQAQANAVAELLADIGSAIQAKYSATGTSATTGHRAIFAHFGFNTGKRMFKEDYTTSEWNSMLKNELNMSRPVLYSGSPPDDSGHTFIIDGYTSSGYFNINWGWGGSYNGSYALDALTPGSHNYKSSQQAYLDCVPATMLPCVAKVNNNVECPSLRAAFSMAPIVGSPISVTMIQDASISNDPVNEDENVILDLNGRKLEVHHYGIYVYGQLRVMDSRGSGKIVAKTGNCSIFSNHGTLNIDNGEYVNELFHEDDTDYRRCIWSDEGSTTYIKNGNFSSTYNVLCIKGDATIENGNFKSTGNGEVLLNYNKSGQMTITGGTFTNTGKQPEGNDYRRCIWTSEDSKTIIKNGKFSSPKTTMYIKGDVTIERGDFETTGNNAVISNYNTSGVLNITGGSFSNKGQKPEGSDYRRCIWTSEDSSTKIKDGIFTNEAATQTLCFNGNATISGGVFENKGTGATCASNADVTISNGMISGSRNLLAWEGASLKCSGGVYSQKVAAGFLANGCYCSENKDAATKQKYPYLVINPVGMEEVHQNEVTESQYYGINGMVMPGKKHGLIIIRDKNGKTTKRYCP